MVSNLEKISSEVIHYGLQSYQKEFKDKRNSIPEEFKKVEEKLSKLNENGDITTEKLREYFELLDSDALYVDNTFIGFLLNAPRPKLDIPEYQRDFSWQTPQHARLWLDLMHFATNLEEGLLPEAFLGSTYVSDESDELQIIDGQQRITSILLIILNIKRELDILISSNETVDDPFWLFVKYYSGEYFLERMMYDFDDPILRPNEPDIGYFDAIFLNDVQAQIDRVAQLDKTEKGGGASIMANTLLENKLGMPPHQIEEHLSISANKKLLRRSSNSNLMNADRFYRQRIGDLVGVFNGIYEESIDFDIVNVDGDQVTVVVTTVSGIQDEAVRYPVANAYIYLVDDNGDREYCGHTQSDGQCTVTISGTESGRKLVAHSFGQEQEIDAEESEDLHPGPLRVLDTESNSQLRLVPFEDGRKNPNGSVTINGNQYTTDNKGIITIELGSIPENQEEKEPTYTIEIGHVEREIKFDSLKELSDLVFNSPTQKFQTDEQRARVLLNLSTILLHSLRVVYAEFGQNTDKGYKINVFQSLNDRGMDLDLSNIIRARVIASEVDNADKWDEIEEDHDLGNGSRIDKFLNDYLVAEQGLTDSNNDDYKSLFSLSAVSMGNATSILNKQKRREAEHNLDELREYSARFVDIVDASIPNRPSQPGQSDSLREFDPNDATRDTELREECETLLSHLNQVGSAWRSLVLAIYRNFSEVRGRGEDFNEILKFVSKLVYRYGLYGTDISSTEMDFIDEVTAIYNGHRDDQPINDHLDPEEVQNLVTKKIPSSLQWDSIVGQAVRKRSWTNKTFENQLTRYIDITLSGSQGGGFIQSKHGINPDVSLSVEHILPTSLIVNGDPDDEFAWLKHFFETVDADTEVGGILEEINDGNQPDEEMMDRLESLFARDIGNMMPLISEDNSSLQTRLYSKKIAYYFLINRDDLLKINEFQATEKYNLEEIVTLIETFADEKNYSDTEFAKILGLLISPDSPSDVDVIHDALTADISKDELESQDPDNDFGQDKTLREATRDMFRQDIIDETSVSAPDDIQKFNDDWTVESVIDRKEYFLKQLLDTLLFKQQNSGSEDGSETDEDDIYSGLRSMIEDDFEERYDFQSI